MFLKYNISNTKKEQRQLEIKNLTYDENNILTVQCVKAHDLRVEDSICIKINNSSFNEILKVKEVIDVTKFTVYYNNIKTIYLSDKINSIYKVKDELPIEETNKDEEFNLIRDNVEYKCTFINKKYFKCDSVLDLNLRYTTKDTRLTNKISDNTLIKDIYIYEVETYLKFEFPLVSNLGVGMNNEDITKQYFEQKKEELISDIIDYEKRCFSPYYTIKYTDTEGNELVGYKPIYSITFNLFFRYKGDSENWTSTDEQYWNKNYKDKDGNDLSTNNGDKLTSIGFENDDILYQKKKLSKSFIRLSFYNSKNPLNQMLLFYSTIFFDTNDLYNKHINGKATTSSFTVYNRYNRDKSSEGFYLYLFPEYVGKEIYMKVEFNHAKYGKNVPLIHPMDSNLKPIEFGTDFFPTSYMFKKDDYNNVITVDNLQSLYDDMYIPINVGYDDDNNEYFYSFGYSDNTNLKEETIINLYEPKIN
jgi:hypothetical protein